MKHITPLRRAAIETAIVGLVLLSLWGISLRNYLLFHSLAELFSIAVAWGIFMVAWNSRALLTHAYLIFLGAGYLYVGGLHIFHTLAYKGMNVFPQTGGNLATQFWIAARFVESASLVGAAFFINRRARPWLMLGGFTLTAGLLLLTILSGNFPDCYVEGQGLTIFKKVAEYVICLLLVLAAVLLFQGREAFETHIFRQLFASIVLTIMGELSFTFYVSVYGLSNLLGHFFKIGAFYLIYRALVHTGIREPVNLLFTELSRSKARYKSLFDNLMDGFALHDIVCNEIGKPVDYIFREVNDRFEQLTGLKRTDILGKPVTAVIPGIEQDPADWIGRYGNVALGGMPVRFEQRSDVLGRWFAVSAYSPRPGQFAAVFEDITARREADEAVLRTRRLYESLAEASPDMVCTMNATGQFTYVNSRWLDYTGPAGSLKRDWPSFVYPDDLDRFRSLHAQGTTDGEPFEGEFRYRGHDGNYRWFWTRAVPVKQKEAKIESWIAVSSDITNRKQVESQRNEHQRQLEKKVSEATAELRHTNRRLMEEIEERTKAEAEVRRSRARYARAAAIGRFGHWELDLLRDAFMWSEEVWSITGLPKRDIAPSFAEFMAYVHEEDREQIRGGLKGIRTSGERFGSEYRLVQPDGNEVFIQSIAEPRKDPEGNVIGLEGVMMDITPRKRAEAETLKAARLASIGQLAAGVAHEINNPINGIINYAQILMDSSEPQTDHDLYGRIQKEGERIADIVRSLLSFARSGGEEHQLISLNEVVAEIVPLVSPQLKKDGIILRTVIPEDLPPVMASCQRLQQVVLNCIHNSRFALIQASRSWKRDMVIEIKGARVRTDNADYLRITISDTGCGIPAHVLNKVFEPFVTTKPAGEGTGLGLSISLGIIREFGGDISIETVEGEFTRILIDLPVGV